MAGGNGEGLRLDNPADDVRGQLAVRARGRDIMSISPAAVGVGIAVIGGGVMGGLISAAEPAEVTWTGSGKSATGKVETDERWNRPIANLLAFTGIGPAGLAGLYIGNKLSPGGAGAVAGAAGGAAAMIAGMIIGNAIPDWRG